MFRKGLISIIGVFASVAVAVADEIPPSWETQGIDARVGMFFQTGGSLATGGVFWAPVYRAPSNSNSRWTLAGRGGFWILKDTGGTPAFSPTIEAGIRYASPFAHLSVVALGSTGYAFVLDQLYFGGNLTVYRDLETDFPLGVSEAGLQYQLISSPQGSNFMGVSLIWRW